MTFLVDHFDELCVFPDLAQEEAAFDNKTHQVEGVKATLEEGQEINEGNVCV